jgi:hypothetical protein
MQLRPASVVVYVSAENACSWHRMILPGHFLASQGSAEVTFEKNIHTAEWFRSVQPDIVVVQRVEDWRQIAHLQECKAASPTTTFVYEIDDLLTEVPQGNIHSAGMPPDMAERVRAAMSIADIVTVTTPTLADWARDEMGAKDIRIVPNLMSGYSIKEREQKPAAKTTRVGWCGGISHAADLELLRHAIENVEGVQWVFFGMAPKFPMPANTEFHDFVPLDQYMSKLASLNLDVMLAPVELNRFNDAKSELKVLEAAAVGAAVIASPAAAYRACGAPVYAFPIHPEEWTAAIQKYADISISQKINISKQMLTWVRSRTYEANAAARNAAWFPSHLQLWQAKGETPGARKLAVVGSIPTRKSVDFETACRAALEDNTDILYLRPGTTITPRGLARLRTAILEDKFTASIAPVASDGVNAFPRQDRIQPVGAEEAEGIDAVLADVAKGQKAIIPVFSGPCLLIRAQGIKTLGMPQFDKYADPEIALMEWTARATERGLRNIQLFDVFAGTTTPSPQLDDDAVKRLTAVGTAKLIQAKATPMAPEIRELAELRCVAATWPGVRQGTGGLASDYATWAALKPFPKTVSDGSKCVIVRGDDPAPEDAEYVVEVSRDAELTPYALALIQDALDAGHAYVFGDHEEIDTNGAVVPFFKPERDDTLRLSYDYYGPVVARNVRAYGNGPSVRIPHILASVKRMTKEEGIAASEVQKRVVEAFWPGDEAKVNTNIPELGYAFYNPVPRGDATVALIIHAQSGDPEVLAACVRAFRQTTDYPISRIVVASSGVAECAESGVEIALVQGGPAVEVLNHAASLCEEDILVFTSDLIRPAEYKWLNGIVGFAERPAYGAVSARIAHGSGVVANVGMMVQNGIPSAPHVNLPVNNAGYFGYSALSHEASAVSRMLLAIRRDLFTLFEFDDLFKSEFADFDLCLKLHGEGYRNVVNCVSNMVFVGGNIPLDQADFAAFRERWKAFVDPYVNPNFAINGLTFDFSTLKGVERNPEGDAVLIINDASALSEVSPVLQYEARNRSITYRAVLSGFSLNSVAPVFSNVRPIDIRDPAHLNRVLSALGIKRVVLPQLVGAAPPPAIVETVRALMKTGVDFHYIGPIEHMLCPRLTMSVDGVSCNKGYEKGPSHCQACIDRHGSPFGYIDVSAWLNSWHGYTESLKNDGA